MKHIIGAIPTGTPSQAKIVLVGEDCTGQRLDNFLLRALKGVPKSHVYRIIRSGEVRVNKGRASADSRVEAGDAVRVPPVRVPERVAHKAQEVAQGEIRKGARVFPILFEDDWLLALDKPAGVAVHGGSGISFGVIEQLRMARPQAGFLELVHRLDRETSGILLVAKRGSALKKLQDQFRGRDIGKTYLALVQGRWSASNKVLDKPLYKYLISANGGIGAGERRVRVVSGDDPNGRHSLTLVKVRQFYPAGFSMLEVTLKTGRTHQIRVHLASEGHPIAGDDKYGDFELNKALRRSATGPGLERMFLHAWRLQFNHPSSGERVELTADLPPELQAFVTHVERTCA